MKRTIPHLISTILFLAVSAAPQYAMATISEADQIATAKKAANNAVLQGYGSGQVNQAGSAAENTAWAAGDTSTMLSIFSTSTILLGAAGMTVAATVNSNNAKFSCSSEGTIDGHPAVAACVRWITPDGTVNPSATTYKTFQYDTVSQLIDNLELSNLSTELPGFNQYKPLLGGRVYLQGVPISTTYIYTQQVGSAVVNRILTISFKDKYGKIQTQSFTDSVNVPETSLNAHLSSAQMAALGDTSGDSIDDQLTNFSKTSAGTTFFNSLLQATVADAPDSPLAGNPASFMAQLVRNDYRLATASSFPTGNPVGSSVFSVTPGVMSMDLGAQASQVYSLPLDYTHYYNDSNALVLSMPISMTSIGNSSSYAAALGASWRHYLTSIWSIAPGVQAGAEGSGDLGSASMVYDGSLTSRVSLPVGRLSYGLTNELSYLTTSSLNPPGVNIAYDLKNGMTSNGVDVSYKFTVPLALSAYFTQTDVIAGNTWYASDYSEVGLKLEQFSVLEKGSPIFYNNLTSSIGYIFGPRDVSGISANIMFSF